MSSSDQMGFLKPNSRSRVPSTSYDILASRRTEAGSLLDKRDTPPLLLISTHPSA